jgi:hypothetical protein
VPAGRRFLFTVALPLAICIDRNGSAAPSGGGTAGSAQDVLNMVAT